MKKQKMMKLALTGLVNGLILNSAALVAAINENDAKPNQSTTTGNGSKVYAAKCGGGSCGGAVAAKCGNGKCGGAVAAKCGNGKCGGAIAAKCGNGSCGGAIASKCGTGKCGSVAARDTTEGNLKLQNPADVKAGEATKSEYGSTPNFHIMSEEELFLELNDEGIKQYNSLSPEGKKLAREVASQTCNNQNSCSHLNACKTENNSCRGKGACKGQSICAHSDKNEAVKVVADKMAEKRAQSAGK